VRSEAHNIRIVDEPDDVLASRLDAEMAAFNFDATGIRDARDFAATVRMRRDLLGDGPA
jgi:hypothetical protein